MDDALSRASTLYRKKRYDLALVILEAHMSSPLWKPHKLNLMQQFRAYEIRASLYERANRLTAALSDANRMIHLQGWNSRGYLRKGRILLLLGRSMEAETIYRLGLAKAAENHDLLLAGEKQASKRIKSRVDPVSRLPAELLVDIFYQFDLSDLGTFCQVSKAWNHFLCNESKLWRHLVFVKAPSKRLTSVPASTVIRYCEHAYNQPLRIDLKYIAVRNPEYLCRYIATRISGRIVSFDSTNVPLNGTKTTFSRLRRLSLVSVALAKDLAWSLEQLPALEELELIAVPGKNQVASLVPSLAVSICKASPHLKHVMLSSQAGCRCLTDLAASELAALPELESLEMHRIIPNMLPALQPAVDGHQLKRFGFTSEGPLSRQVSFPLPFFASCNLCSLTLNNLQLSIPPMDPEIGSQCPLSLTYLELKHTTVINGHIGGIVKYFASESNLITLVLHQSLLLGSWAEFMLLNLEQLQFTGMPAMDDKQFENLLGSLPSLLKANFDNTPITGSRLLQLIKHGLRAVRCKGIEMLGPDTVEWISSTGVNVVY